ncbi:hypothetical protein CR205_00980 [Alteribacter lacisalsi]|uniref:Radical SAM protein n=1 Tax=Alteribacter lacisalsi TaxID=2045244 RepID=A0A2W0H7U1_9BACI|nr:hypothetical protein [Alteribacter lacisalsi]PYZ97207.1 hypothetical protein CR205_00980 [Alteribacter lacisalsi]
MKSHFRYDTRLGIDVPALTMEWGSLECTEQSFILEKWEKVRGSIPDRIAGIEKIIEKKQQALYEEEDFEQSCRLNSEIAELASIVNDLWIWYRSGEHLSVESRLHT